jgi:hypothetical protein
MSTELSEDNNLFISVCNCSEVGGGGGGDEAAFIFMELLFVCSYNVLEKPLY